MIVAIASGKGGVGKTMLAVNLARVAPEPVQLLDCDAEEPNCHLFIRGESRGHEVVTVGVPEVDESLCDGCGECSRFCRFHAIVSLPRAPLVVPELCHSCGGCMVVCPRNAIREVRKPVGAIDTIDAGWVSLVSGRLDVGVAIVTPLIAEVKARAARDRLVIVDAPPGTSCPVVTALRGADAAVFISEPTPFGLHDLRLAVDLAREMDIPCAVVLNRAGSGDRRVNEFCNERSVPLLGEIPFDRRIARHYAEGEVIVDAIPKYRPLFEKLYGGITGFCAAAMEAGNVR